MKRKTNYYYEISFYAPLCFMLVHGGGSQGGRSLSPEARGKFWVKNIRGWPDGLTAQHDCCKPGAECDCGVVRVRFTPSALQTMTNESPVMVSNPKKPRIWTPKRIVQFGKRIEALTGSSESVQNPTARGARRKGGLQL